MNLFISWSGERSEKVAQALHPWIKCVIQNIEPFFSPSDITGGSIWINQLYSKLGNSNAGIICLTPENQHKPWIQFEAGALAKGLSENRVFILLIGLDSSQVTGPLSSFNHSPCTREGIEKLVKNLNDLTGNQSLPNEILTKVFSKYYSELETEIQLALKIKPDAEEKPKRANSDIQNEMLTLLRNLSNRVSNLEHSLTSSNGIKLKSKIPSPENIFKVNGKLVKIISEMDGIDKNRLVEILDKAEIDSEISNSSSLEGGV